MAETKRGEPPLFVEAGDVEPRDPTAHELTPETGTPGFAKGASGQALDENDTEHELGDQEGVDRGSANPEQYRRTRP